MRVISDAESNKENIDPNMILLPAHHPHDDSFFHNGNTGGSSNHALLVCDESINVKTMADSYPPASGDSSCTTISPKLNFTR